MTNRPSNILPDVDLQQFIATLKTVGKKKQWFVDIEGTPVRVYTQGEKSLSAKDKEYIEIIQNGVVSAQTRQFDDPEGNLAFGIHVATTNGVVNRTRHTYILSHIEELLNSKKSDKYFYELSMQDIMNLTNNFINGYSSQVLNIAWMKTN